MALDLVKPIVIGCALPKDGDFKIRMCYKYVNLVT